MKKIYIVDDDRNIVESLTMILEKEGHQVKAQHDENNLIENMLEFSPDLIILDVMFPENSSAGFEMARELQKNDRLGTLPIFMLSAINEKNIYCGKFSNKDIDGSLLPVKEFIEKPVNPKNLVEKINSTFA